MCGSKVFTSHVTTESKERDDHLSGFVIDVSHPSEKEGLYVRVYRRNDIEKVVTTQERTRAKVFSTENRASRRIRDLRKTFGDAYRFEIKPDNSSTSIEELEQELGLKTEEKFSPHKKWICAKNSDEETWKACEFYDFKYQAIRAAKAHIIAHNKGKTKAEFEDVFGYYPNSNGEIISFAVGQCVVADVSFDVSSFLETIGDEMYSEYDAAEDYLRDVTEEHKEELESLINDWFTRHDYTPKFYKIQNVETVLVI